MEQAGDSVAPKENGDETLPPTGCHLTANSNEIIEPLALHGVEDGLVNVL
jgi:hypothetical protein